MRAGWMFGAMVALTAGVGVAVGCANGGDGDVGGATTTLSSSSSSTSASSGASSSGSSGTSTASSSSGSGSSSGQAPGAKIVINEICAKGGNWVELVNPGASGVDIGGYGLCDDVDPTMGHTCDTTTIVTFPTGTMVPPGGYVLVVGTEASDAGVGPHVACLADGGPTSCFYASWKISASNGEMIHLVDTTMAVVDQELYPMNAVPSGQTWGRLPDKTGAFAANQPTPGAANAAP